MATQEENRTRTEIQLFLGVPVMVQLRIPLVGMSVHPQKMTLPMATEPDKKQWVPRAIMVPVDSTQPDGEKQPVTTQLVEMCTLHSTEDAARIELRWLAPVDGVRVAQLGTLISTTDIAAVTRIIDLPEPSSILLK